MVGRSKTPEQRWATTVYWVCLLGAVISACVLSLATEEPAFVLLLVAMFLPAGQLGASLVAGTVAGIVMGRKPLPRVWSITWRGFLGAVIGLGIMLIPVFAANNSQQGLFLVILGLVVISAFLYWLRRRGERARYEP